MDTICDPHTHTHTQDTKNSMTRSIDKIFGACIDYLKSEGSFEMVFDLSKTERGLV